MFIIYTIYGNKSGIQVMSKRLMDLDLELNFIRVDAVDPNPDFN